MIKRSIEISREPCHLTVRDGQLLVLRKSKNEPRSRLPANPSDLAGSIPCEDIGVVMVDERDTTYTHSALAALAEHGAAVVVCGRDHQPTGMYLPISAHTHLLARLEAQLSASRPTRKRIWSAIVSAKVRAQAWALPPTPAADGVRPRLEAMAARVRSGDPENVEAQAAAIYWPVLFDRADGVTRPFRRRAGDRSAPPPNNLLDYGYAALRAAIARALVSAGLLPAIGVQHYGRANPFCLADDLMEPLRPLVDVRVRGLAERGELWIDQPTKAELLGVLTDEIGPGPGKTGPLLVSVSRYVASFAEALEAGPDALRIPEPGAVVSGAERWS